ncbi:CRISPR-associated RAMP Crm2 family protein [Methylocaldum marinum]|uniref:CRISPR-associated RAMP Crm2 family protein n=1 Tax=Methylocaldum marinum TaxID=1432792 RepID=A0A250KX15_9GAMM|nr:type III-B CRISPR-associated protein Cas10/Cmr2 [Methylocaldum marinum]BBA36066.1 CRISPR-associated RAMP Crm2 family protein [Methylocaldum marinum]
MELTHWHAKLAAWTHDPAEKALVLLRDPAGHEGGTAAALQTAIFGQPGIPADLRDIVAKADRWASAGDRPQWPRDQKDSRYAGWAQIRFDESPVLIHPLSGERYDLPKLTEIDAEHIKAVSTAHFKELVQPGNNNTVDARKTALAFWRFGPEPPASQLGKLWDLLPADTRVPDHTIWAHLDLTAAYASAFRADPDRNPALLAVSLGPVQDFIAQARTTSDLWAGSHFLSRLAWEAIRVICERFGPDAVLFPQLRGVPLVDLWLRDQIGLPKERFADCDWTKGQTDANPLFAAALPNRFVALIPAAQAEKLADDIQQAVREFALAQAGRALDLLCRKVERSGRPKVAEAQIAEQLAGFPEVHWAAVEWGSLIEERSGQPPATAKLEQAMRLFHPEGNGKPGFLGSEAWKLLSKELKVEGQTFFAPNPGVLYPAVYDLLDRAQAAAKAVRTFAQSPQEGYRCSLCGEREWLSDERELLHLAPGRRKESGSLWERVQGTGLARKGEHLCAPCTLKRFWPSLFAEDIRTAIQPAKPLNRYVVSTHTMALATTFWNWLKGNWGNNDAMSPNVLRFANELTRYEKAALPKKVADELRRGEYLDPIRAITERLPTYLDAIKELDQGSDSGTRERALDETMEKVLGGKPETYYALILMDGDRMGAWLSGQGEEGKGYLLPFEDTWHPHIREVIGRRHPSGDLADYRKARRPVSPARHMAISAALNGYALHQARHIVEDCGKGKLIYAGGDDVLAMVSVDDLLSVMFLLRLAYSGVFPDNATTAWKLLGTESSRLDLRRGHVLYNNRLYRVMGHKATASMGAVVAHHQAPLGYVLRQLREAEKRAKSRGGRDAFSISLLKRSGGAVHLTSPWLEREPGARSNWETLSDIDIETTPMGQLIRLRNRFAGEGFSRRAAYLTHGWLENMPADPESLAGMLGYQFARQSGGDTVLETYGRSLAGLAHAVEPGNPAGFIRDFLAVAEFLAREGRSNHCMAEDPGMR